MISEPLEISFHSVSAKKMLNWALSFVGLGTSFNHCMLWTAEKFLIRSKINFLDLSLFWPHRFHVNEHSLHLISHASLVHLDNSMRVTKLNNYYRVPASGYLVVIYKLINSKWNYRWYLDAQASMWMPPPAIAHSYIWPCSDRDLDPRPSNLVSSSVAVTTPITKVRCNVVVHLVLRYRANRTHTRTHGRRQKFMDRRAENITLPLHLMMAEA